MRTFILMMVLLLVTFVTLPLHSQEFKWQENEELSYGVDWTVVRLGKIHLKNLGRENINNKSTYHIRLIIESNPLLFWLDNQSVYDSYITDSLQVVRFLSDEKVDGKVYNARYDFDYDNQIINLSMLDKENPENKINKTLPLKPNIYDGISLIFYARMNSLYVKDDTVSTFIEDKSGDVIFNFKNSKQTSKIDALDKEVKTSYFSGTLKVTGIAGVTGPFEAWFSDDAYRLPVVSYLDVFIGSVKISLEKWNYWKPTY
ncbi:MAG: DUF3108 domain-containing protein [Calditrichaeota bacterium]|nr:DUF3108 domain-containing protein [Calditrichota bacterium]